MGLLACASDRDWGETGDMKYLAPSGDFVLGSEDPAIKPYRLSITIQPIRGGAEGKSEPLLDPTR